MKNKCYAIDKLLSEHWFTTEKEAAAWIMERKVLANDTAVLTPRQIIPTDAVIRVKESYKRKYVNKGGLKLEGAIRDFGISVADRVTLDCGASTGGFTDCLLQFGAKRVYAVDAGFGQLDWKLISDPKVINMEKTNLGDQALLNLDPRPEIITLDLSYLSLKKALPICRGILGDKGLAICLVKPIFEVESSEIRRTGKINDHEILKDILIDLCGYFIKMEVNVGGVTNSPVTGNSGTLEFFVSVHWGIDGLRNCNSDYGEEIEKALTRSSALNVFNKNS